MVMRKAENSNQGVSAIFLYCQGSSLISITNRREMPGAYTPTALKLAIGRRAHMVPLDRSRWWPIKVVRTMSVCIWICITSHCSPLRVAVCRTHYLHVH